MAIADPNKLGKVTDLTADINIVPNQWGVVNSMNVFKNEMKSQKTVLVPRTTEQDALIPDRNWDERNNTIKGGSRDMLPVQIPHFPVDDAITPNDIDGVIDFTSLFAGGANTESVDKVRAAKMERLRRAHAITLEWARMQMLKNGTAYAPNGTVVLDLYSEYSVSREVIYFDLTNTTESPIGKPETAIAHIQDSVGSNNGIVDGFTALASPGFFNKLIANDYVVETYTGFAQEQSAILNARLTNRQGLDNRFRSFSYGGIDFIEVRGKINGQDLVEADKAYCFPRGTDLFRTFFAPANRFATVNKPAQESYYFEYLNEKDDIIEIMTETNFLNFIANPAAVVTLDAGSDN